MPSKDEEDTQDKSADIISFLASEENVWQGVSSVKKIESHPNKPGVGNVSQTKKYTEGKSFSTDTKEIFIPGSKLKNRKNMDESGSTSTLVDMLDTSTDKTQPSPETSSKPKSKWFQKAKGIEDERKKNAAKSAEKVAEDVEENDEDENIDRNKPNQSVTNQQKNVSKKETLTKKTDNSLPKAFNPNAISAEEFMAQARKSIVSKNKAVTKPVDTFTE